MQVQPNLANDPAARKNQIGTIVASDPGNDNITVQFSDGGRAGFSTNALLVLRKLAEMQRDAANDVTLLPFYDYQDLRGIIAFADSPLTENKRLAIELAKKCPAILEYAMSSLPHELGLKQSYGMGR